MRHDLVIVWFLHAMPNLLCLYYIMILLLYIHLINDNYKIVREIDYFNWLALVNLVARLGFFHERLIRWDGQIVWPIGLDPRPVKGLVHGIRKNVQFLISGLDIIKSDLSCVCAYIFICWLVWCLIKCDDVWDAWWTLWAIFHGL